MDSKGLPYWVDKLSSTEMPILSTMVKQLNQLTGNDDAEINQLAEVILKDPHMTSQILKVANSVQYNPLNTGISTVSRAIVMLGFRGVRSLCVSLMVVDSLLGQEPRERLLEAMAKAFHAATLARTIHQKITGKQDEEVFIAALLYHLGEMAFWAYGGQTADSLDFLENGNDKIEKTLGTTFHNLSKGLCKTWNLGAVLEETLNSDGKGSKACQAVRLGDRISRLEPADTADFEEALKNIASFTGESVKETKKLVAENTEAAAVVALEFGAAKACHLIPGQRKDSTIESVKKEEATIMSADTNLQLKVLRDLASAVSDDGVDVNTVFQMALEGMHRGIGLERVVLAFFVKKKIRCKYVLGEATKGWRESFAFDTGDAGSTIFTECVHWPQPVWLDEGWIRKNGSLYTPDVLKVTGKQAAFIGILRVNSRNAALFYADRGATGEELSQDHFEAFRHFLNQCELSVQAMADKRAKG